MLLDLNSNICFSSSRVVLRSSRSGQRLDGQHKPSSDCPTAVYDDADDIVFDVLPSPRPQDTCSFETLVTLDSNLQCEGRECAISTVRVVEVMQGIHLACCPTCIGTYHLSNFSYYAQSQVSSMNTFHRPVCIYLSMMMRSK